MKRISASTLLMFALLALPYTIVSAANLPAALDQQEQAIAAAVVAREAEALALLEQAVNINSGTKNFAGVQAVGRVFSSAFTQLGFATQWVEGAEFERAGHLVASYGSSGPRLLLIGHLDTVFATDSPFQTWERLDEHHVRGPGITDMKGGNVVMILALTALKDAGLLDSVQVRVVLTGDEESRGRPMDIANRALIDAAVWADYAIGFEDGDGDPTTAVVSRRSAGNWALEVSGKPAHSSQIFRDDVGFGAIFESARILDSWRVSLATVPNLTFNPGKIIGGTQITSDASGDRGTAFGKNNVIAQTGLVSGGIRADSPEQLDMAINQMAAIVSESLPHTQASFSFTPGYPPMARTQGNLDLLARYTAISESLGYGEVLPVDPRRAGAADISFAAEHVRGAIDGLGLMGTGGHTIEEIADIRTLKQQAQRAAVLFYQLGQVYGQASPQ
ncbi:MAG: M20/M25/M40 family metallo-hydrolase [Halioglobus sp.]